MGAAKRRPLHSRIRHGVRRATFPQGKVLRNWNLPWLHIFGAGEYHGMSGSKALGFLLMEVLCMYNNGFCGGNWCWIIILLILFCGCGNGTMNSNSCGNGCGCGCDNNCGCC